MQEGIHPCETHMTCKMSTQEVEEQLSIATLGNKDSGEDKYGLIINTHLWSIYSLVTCTEKILQEVIYAYTVENDIYLTAFASNYQASF